jgi:hypothetical protein
MGSIEIVEPELQIRMEVNYLPFDQWTDDATHDATFYLVFGDVRVAQQSYAIPVYDDDDYAMNDCWDKFRKYVAERLATLFEEDSKK